MRPLFLKSCPACREPFRCLPTPRAPRACGADEEQWNAPCTDFENKRVADDAPDAERSRSLTSLPLLLLKAQQGTIESQPLTSGAKTH
jgi:hypothetical protein